MGCNCKDDKFPSIKEQVFSFTKAIANHVKTGAHLVDKDEFEFRVNQCLDCKYIRGRRCLLCGCFVDVKARMLSEYCPVDRWKNRFSVQIERTPIEVRKLAPSFPIKKVRKK